MKRRGKSRRSHPSEDAIRHRAAELYERSGRIEGRDWENWLAAEAELRAEIQAAPRTGPCPPGFKMPDSDAALWIEKKFCTEVVRPIPLDPGP
jgi:hypothetical protein